MSVLVERLVVVGASAGGLAALQVLVADLPADLPAAVLVVMHLPLSAENALPTVLSRTGPLTARHPRNGERLAPGEILVAPPDQHLLVRDCAVRLSRGPRHNRQRPAVDPLFRSAALAFGPQVVAVVLSGALDDGAIGAAAVAAQDGAVLVQDPAEARVSSMPRSALAAVRKARAVPTAQLGTAVADIVRRSAAPPSSLEPKDERSPAMTGPTAATDLGLPAAVGCPECQGGMFESTPAGTVTYTCHVGHTWSAQSLLEAEQEAVEGAIYSAAAKLMETAAVRRRLAERGGDDAEDHLAAARAAERQATRIGELAAEDPGPN